MEININDADANEKTKNFENLAKYDTMADIWSLGCVVYYIATGRHLFEENDVDRITDMLSIYHFDDVE